jgi:putative endopeptidase
MKFTQIFCPLLALLCIHAAGAEESKPPAIPRFSIDYMDRTVDPGADFYHFAVGNWLKNNPVPPDKSRWASFTELQEQNWRSLRQILEQASAESPTSPKSPRRQVGDFFASAMDTNRIEELKFKPVADDLRKIDSLLSTNDLFALLADFHRRGIGGIFGASVGPDARNSAIYAFELRQGGLSLPDRDYYLKESFASQRAAYQTHLRKMFSLLGQAPAQATNDAETVVSMETALAKASRARVDLRDPNKNYNKLTQAELGAKAPAITWPLYFTGSELETPPPYVIVGQPEFFEAASKLLSERPLSDWKTYLRWHLLHASAPFLHRAVETEDFDFYHKTLTGQVEPEPRWKRSAGFIDRSIGEALGQLYVEKNFPPQARARMNDLVENLKAVFRDHLKQVDWMADSTRAKAMAKFEKFTQKIGHPDKFRDYSTIEILRDDFLGNIRRAAAFESHREVRRVGKPVDRTEWEMTPPTVNAYFNPLQNEIVFPAGILQPPFFDVTMDDPVNYGAIGVVIGHEITHGYDDQGRKYDAQGNLSDWWTEQDAKTFEARAQKVADEYNAFEPLPGLHVNGKLTLGENLADLGGVTISYDAMERALAKNPAKRKKIDGFTPEQRFFISFAQVWRVNIRDAEVRRLVTVDPHSPGRYRAWGPLVNFQPFYDAFGIKEGAAIWRAPELRAKIW